MHCASLTPIGCVSWSQVLPAAMLFHNIEWIADGVSHFVSKPRRGPFFAYVGWTLPHNPDVLLSLQADPRFTPAGLWGANRDQVLGQREAVCRAANVSTEALLGATDEKSARRQTVPMSAGVAASPRFGHRHYPLALAWLDSGVASVMEALKAARLDASTLTIFTSDHAAFDKGHCYTGGSRIPLLFSWPALLATRPVPLPPLPHPVSHLDLLPTILHAANVPLGEPPPPPPPSLPASAAATAAIADTAVEAASGDSATPKLTSRSISVATAGGEGPLLSSELTGRSLAALLVGAARGELHERGSAWQAAWAHGSAHQRTLFCEVGQSRAVFTSRCVPHAAQPAPCPDGKHHVPTTSPCAFPRRRGLPYTGGLTERVCLSSGQIASSTRRASSRSQREAAQMSRRTISRTATMCTTGGRCSCTTSRATRANSATSSTQRSVRRST